MAWLSGSLTSPRDAGGPRAGGSRVQMPNWMRVAVPGGEAIAPVGDVSIAIAGGATATIPGGVYATLSGSPALAVTTTHYITYVTTAAPSVLLACKQESWAAIYSAADVVGIGYHTDHHDMRLPLSAIAASAGGGSVGHLVFYAHFDSTSLLTAILVLAGTAKNASGATIAFSNTYMPVPGGVAGTYLVCVNAAGAMTLSFAQPAGTTKLAQINVSNRPTNTFDVGYSVEGGIALAHLFDPGSGGAVVTAGAPAIPQSAYRTDLTPGFLFHDSSPPTDGHGGYTYRATYHGATLVTCTVVIAADHIPSIPIPSAWADPLCGMMLNVSSGSPVVPFGPTAQANGPQGDYGITIATDNAAWNGLYSPLRNGVIGTGSVAGPTRYMGCADGSTDFGFLGAGGSWWTFPSAHITAEYIAP